MAIRLLRHTRPVGAEGLCYGRLDLPVDDSFASEVDRLQAEIEPAAAIVSSPLSRCRQLAEALAVRRGLAVRICPDLIEMDFGRWEGQQWSDLPRVELDAWAAEFMTAAPHGGESVQDLADRVARGLRQVAEGSLVVTHAGVIKAALAARGVPGAWEAQTPFGGVVTL